MIGSVGMAIGNRGHSKKEQNNRWLKFFMYVLITVVMLTSIFLHFLGIPGVIIVTVGFYEVVRAKPRSFLLLKAMAVYVLLAIGFLVFCWRLKMEQQLFIYFQVFTFDAFSQITGQAFGKHKLLASVSPGKTIEGLVGGILFCCLSAFLARNIMGLDGWTSLRYGVLTSITALSGDLLASLYKRRVGIKDYSSLLPGQGGFLDRFDSLILTGAVYVLIFSMK